jgi:hypothetical protein
MKKKPIAVLFTQRETARVLEITAPRLARALRRGAVQPDFIANSCNLFLPTTVRRLVTQKSKLFPL